MWKLCVVFILIAFVGCSPGLYNQGRQQTERGEYDKAIETFYSQIRTEPESADAWRELGVALYKKGDQSKAVEALMQANTIRPDARTNLFIGLVYEKQELPEKAIEAYRTALSLKPGGETDKMIRLRLDRLVASRIQREATYALEHEADLRADTIAENTIAVVDFDNSQLPPELAPVSKGLAELTAIDLAKVKSLRVVDRLKIDAILKELKLGASRYADPAYAPRMGRLLGSEHIVTGSILGIGDDALRLDGAVVNTRDSSTEITPSTEGELEKFFQVQKDFVFKIVDNLGVELTADERDAIEEIPTESYLAFMAYCRGLDFKSRGMYREATQEFQQAAGLDKGFGEAVLQKEAVSLASAAVGTEITASFESFEEALMSLSDMELLTGMLDQFQINSLFNSGFIRDLGILDRFGNPPLSPPRTPDVGGSVTLQIRGILDAQY